MAKQRKSGSKSKNRKGAKRGGKLPKSYIKKFGGLKAAWRAFKSGKKLPKKKKAKKSTKKAKGGKKLTKKQKAARKGAATKRRNAAAHEGKKKPAKRKGGKRKGSKKGKGEGNLAAQIQKSKNALATIEARYEARRVPPPRAVAPGSEETEPPPVPTPRRCRLHRGRWRSTRLNS